MIKKIQIKGILGIEEKEIETGKINLIKGKTGSGKTSIIDALGIAYRNECKRGTVVHKDSSKGTIYIEHNDNSSVKRMINKTGKTTTLNFEKDGSKKTSPGTALKEMFGELAFLPSNFMSKTKKEQKNIILSMIPMVVNEEEFVKEFGDIDVNLDMHGLEVYKKAESIIYNKRTGVNGEIKAITSNIEGLKSRIPENFESEKWEKIVLSELSKKIIEGEITNKNIDKGEKFIFSYEDDLNLEIKKTKESFRETFEINNKRILEDISDLENKKKELEERIMKRKKDLNENSEKHDIELEKTLDGIKIDMNVKKEKVDVYLKNNKKIDVDKLQEDIENAETNKGFVGMAKELKENEKMLKEANEIKNDLTKKLEISRNKPNELLKNIDMPIEGLGIDEKGNIIINGLDISNLSDGEQWKLVCEIAMKEIEKKENSLKVICLDGFEKLNDESKKEFIEYLKTKEFQFFITEVADGDLEIETL